jgi:hypothetical protein
MLASFSAGATMLGMARGAMDVFMEVLPTRGPITFTGWTKTAEAPVLHHQLARAQLDLEAAELFQDKLLRQWQAALDRKMTLFDRVQSRAWFGEITRLVRDCATGLFRPAVLRRWFWTPISNGISVISTSQPSTLICSRTAPASSTVECWREWRRTRCSCKHRRRAHARCTRTYGLLAR